MGSGSAVSVVGLGSSGALAREEKDGETGEMEDVGDGKAGATKRNAGMWVGLVGADDALGRRGEARP
jgi:hypothetical protein